MVLQNLKNFIKKKGGWIPFDSFMFECLYGNDDSYYMRKNTSFSGLPFGPSGDYVTSASLGHWMAKAYAHSYARIISKTPALIRKYSQLENMVLVMENWRLKFLLSFLIKIYH